MEPYIIILLINLLLSYIAEKCYERAKISSALTILVLVLINTIFSGFRDFGIGVDTTVYIESSFMDVQSIRSVKDFLLLDGDKGFIFLAYIASIFSDDSQALLVAVALFIQIFFYLALWQYKKSNDISFFVATALFCIVFFCHTLNLMRQFCAISVLAFAFSFYIQGKWKKYLLLQILAFFFHTSSIIFIFVPIFWNISRITDVKKRNIYFFLIILGLICFISFYFYFLTLLGDFSIISDTYVDRYGSSGEYSKKISSTGTGLGNVVWFCYPIAYICYAMYKKVENKQYLFFLLLLSTSYSLLQLLSYQVRFMDRIAYYLSFIYFIFLSRIFTSKKMPLFVKSIMIYLYVVTWINLYIISEGGDILPYKSKILNIR